jgi:hypothetical protein
VRFRQLGDHFADHVARDGEGLDRISAGNIDANYLPEPVDHRAATPVISKSSVVNEDLGETVLAQIPACVPPGDGQRDGGFHQRKKHVAGFPRALDRQVDPFTCSQRCAAFFQNLGEFLRRRRGDIVQARDQVAGLEDVASLFKVEAFGMKAGEDDDGRGR